MVHGGYSDNVGSYLIQVFFKPYIINSAALHVEYGNLDAVTQVLPKALRDIQQSQWMKY
jgi:hypothetical protein